MSSPEKQPTNLFPHLPRYKPPQHGLLSYLPSTWIPYGDFMRLSRPIGIIMIYCPYLFGTIFAAAVSQPRSSPASLLNTNIILLVATVFLRGGAVAFNDLADRDLDGEIARTRHRPLARKAITPLSGYTFVAAQAAILLAIQVALSQQCIKYALPLPVFVGMYAYPKRVTDFTSVPLGFTIAWGVLLGCAAMGFDPTRLVLDGETAKGAALCCFYLSSAVWTNIYETIYAHQDILDDEKQGVSSMAIRLKGKVESVLYLLTFLQVSLLECTGWLIEAGVLCFVECCLGGAISLCAMIWKVDLMQPGHYWWWFSNGTWFVGGSVALRFLGQIWGNDILRFLLADLA